jgi:hypothetical protein
MIEQIPSEYYTAIFVAIINGYYEDCVERCTCLPDNIKKPYAT